MGEELCFTFQSVVSTKTHLVKYVEVSFILVLTYNTGLEIKEKYVYETFINFSHFTTIHCQKKLNHTQTHKFITFLKLEWIKLFLYLLDRNIACNMTILYTCNWETLFTFSRRKLDIFPPSGSPPRLNWISTYLPWNNTHKLLNKVVSLNLSLP